MLSRELSEKLFGQDNPVGRTIRMDGTEWQIVGVSDTWQPRPRYYRLINGNGGSFTGNDELFIPFQTAIRHEMGNNGNTNCTCCGRARETRRRHGGRQTAVSEWRAAGSRRYRLARWFRLELWA